MRYFLNLFSPETYEAFTQLGDRLLGDMTKLSRWVGVLEVESRPFEDDTPVFHERNDPFVVRFKVRPVAWLPKDKALPIHDDEVWNALSFTRGHDKRGLSWTGRVRASLTRMDDADGQQLEQLIGRRSSNGRTYPVPAHAGIDRAVSRRALGDQRLPRPRGDRPGKQNVTFDVHLAPPPTRE